MKIWLFLLFVILSSCGKKYEQFHIDTELQTYVDDFVLAAKIRGQQVNLKDIIIKLGNANDYKPQVNKIGYCLYQRDSGNVSIFEDTEETNIVIIDEKFFNRTDISDFTRRELIFHELGHCVLNRLHDERISNGIPESIMYPSSVSLRNLFFYQFNESKYFDELFKISNSVFESPNSNNIIQNIERIENNSEPILFITTEDGGCIQTQ